jgi:ketosteroid isomerase-like protein
MSASGASVSTLKALVKAFNDHDLDRIMSFFADDAVLEMPRGPDPWGRRHVGSAAVRQGLRARFEGLPDVHYGNDSHYVDGDMGISQWTVTGTTQSGERIEARGCDFYTFRNDKVVKKDSFWKIVERT